MKTVSDLSTLMFVVAKAKEPTKDDRIKTAENSFFIFPPLGSLLFRMGGN
jgi:hypothetical protein